MCVYIYIYIYTHICIYICIYVWHSSHLIYPIDMTFSYETWLVFNILEKWQIPRQNNLNQLAENARFVAPSKCCKSSPLHPWMPRLFCKWQFMSQIRPITNKWVVSCCPPLAFYCTLTLTRLTPDVESCHRWVMLQMNESCHVVYHSHLWHDSSICDTTHTWSRVVSHVHESRSVYSSLTYRRIWV